jgi:hypothetical protein
MLVLRVRVRQHGGGLRSRFAERHAKLRLPAERDSQGQHPVVEHQRCPKVFTEVVGRSKKQKGSTVMTNEQKKAIATVFGEQIASTLVNSENYAALEALSQAAISALRRTVLKTQGSVGQLAAAKAVFDAIEIL